MASATGSDFDAGGLLKLVVSLMLAAVAVAAAVVFLVVAGAVAPGGLPLLWGDAATLLGQAASLPLGSRLAVAGGALLIGVLALFELVRLFRREGHSSTLHVLTTDERGFVVIDSRGIATVATQAARGTQGVVEAEVRVKGNGRGPVRLVVELGMYPGANVKRGGEEARDAVRDAVQRLVGVELRDVVVAVRVLETDRLARLLE